MAKLWALGIFFVSLAAAGAELPAAQQTASSLYTTPQFRKLSVEDGLPSSKVYKIAEDQDGFIWFGTHDGLARYDGLGFRVWRHAPSDSHSLANNEVGTLFVDRRNYLWCGGEDSGLNQMNPQRVGFKHFRHTASDPSSLSGDDVWAVAEDGDDRLWIGTYAGGLDRLNLDETGFTHFRHDPAQPDSLASNNVLVIMPDRAGRLWIGTDLGVDVRETMGGFRHIDLSSLLPDGRAPMALSFLEEPNGDMLVGTRVGVLRINPDTYVAVPASPMFSYVSGLLRDRHGELWVGTNKGLRRRGLDGHWDTHTANPVIANSLPGEFISDVINDHEGGLWVALMDGGVAVLSPQWRNFSLFRNIPSDTHSLRGAFPPLVSADTAGKLWLATARRSVERLDPSIGIVEREVLAQPMPDLRWQALFVDHSDQLWVGAFLRVFLYKNNKNVEINLNTKNADALTSGFVDQLIEGPDKAIWVNVHGSGVARIDAHTQGLKNYPVNGTNGLRSGDIEQIQFSPQGDLLVASAVGLDRLDLSMNQFKPIEGIPTSRVHAFAFASDGTLWVHQFGALDHYRLADDHVELLQRIDAADGWPAIRVNGLRLDQSGSLWVSGPRGLFRIDPLQRLIQRYDAHDGTGGSEFNDLLQLPDGRMFVSKLNGGLVGFDPAKLQTNPIAPPLRLTGLELRRGGELLTLDPSLPSMNLQWDDRDIRIHARALSYANPVGNRYQFQLNGFDVDWVDTGNRGEREFTQLAPGQYGLRVRAANANGVWSETLNGFTLNIAPPPWRTTWAYALYLLLASALILFLFQAYRSRIKRRYRFALIEQQRQWAEQANASKSRFLASMAHEIRTPMTGVLGMAELLQHTSLDARQQNYVYAIRHSGEQMLGLVNDALDLARIEAGMLELQVQSLDLYTLIRDCAVFLAALAERKALDFIVEIAPAVPQWVLGDARRIEQIILNLGNNAIKFTEQGKVKLEVMDQPDGSLRLCMHDTGPGIDAETCARLFQPFVQADGAVAQRYGGSGLGLAICRQLVACMDGAITLESAPGEGSVFSVSLPLRATTAAESELNKNKNVLKNTNKKELYAPQPGQTALLVEDDPTVAQVISALLEVQGWRVRHAPQGLVALGELQRNEITLAIFDLNLPGVDGYTLARLQRQREREHGLTALPLIAVTASCNGDEETLARAAGMDGFLRKPLTGAMLRDVIEKVLRK